MTLLHHPEDSGPEAVERVLELFREFDSAMLVTHTSDGGMHGRPMSLAEVEPDGTIWFMTDQTSHKAAEIQADARALVVFQSSKRFVVANGGIALVNNREKIRELWKAADKLWFHDENDPNIVLLRFSPVDAEYWDTSGLRGLKYAFKAAKAYVTGQEAKKELEPEVHGKVNG